MKTILSIVIVSCFATMAFADNASTGTATQGSSTNIVKAVWKIDAWIKENLW